MHENMYIKYTFYMHGSVYRIHLLIISKQHYWMAYKYNLIWNINIFSFLVHWEWLSTHSTEYLQGKLFIFLRKVYNKNKIPIPFHKSTTFGTILIMINGTYPWPFVTQIFRNGKLSHVGDQQSFEVVTSS